MPFSRVLRQLPKRYLRKASSNSIWKKNNHNIHLLNKRYFANARMQTFTIYRWNPHNEAAPEERSYEVDVSDCPMILDILFKIKNQQDPTLSFRRSCREGICGSCSMNIDGTNTLACLQRTKPGSGHKTRILPLPHTQVVRDLVGDLTMFYEHYKTIQPWLQRKSSKQHEDVEHYQSIENRKKLDGMYECILCACCSTSCPSFWWNSDKYYGPAALMQAYRWIADSRDEYSKERLERLNDEWKLYRCHGIMNCSNTCPKHLEPAKFIHYIKKEIDAM